MNPDTRLPSFAEGVTQKAHEYFMRRALELARKGAGHVAPNPLVGAVLVHEDNIIGEGFYEQYGQAHAEVNCIAQAIGKGHAALLEKATMYVTLEPCAHFGKTPPCADLIIVHRIPRVVIGCRDPFKEVDGRGIGKLQAAGVEVITGVLEKECMHMNRRFFCFHNRHRPYIILKWAQSSDGKIAGSKEGKERQRVKISNDYSDRLVHRWRATEAAILVGTATALADDPSLTTRWWPGPSPVRMVLDLNLRLPASLRLFDHSVPTVVFNSIKNAEEENLSFHQLPAQGNTVLHMMEAMFRMNIQSVLVEGGAHLLQSFIEEGCWDEARIITANNLVIGEGLCAPQLKQAKKTGETSLLQDRIEYYSPLN